MSANITGRRDAALPVDRAASSQARAILQVLLVVAVVVSGLWMLYRLASVVLVLVVAALFAYVIAPLVHLAGRPVRVAGRPRRLSRGAAIAVVYVLMAGGASMSAALLLPSATEQVNEIILRAPTYAQSFITWKHGWSRYYQRLRLPLELRESIDQSVVAAGEAGVTSARASFVAIVSALTNLPLLILIPIFAFFFLKDAASFRRTVVAALPQRIGARGDRLIEDLNTALAAYVRAQLLACVLVGTLCGVGFAVLGIPYSVLLGVLAGVLEFIPLVGPVLLAIVASIVAALHSPALLFWAIGFLAVLRLAEDYVIYPRLIGRGIELHPFVVILAVLVGAELGGVEGIFLAVPVVAMASVLYRHSRDWRGGNGDGGSDSYIKQAPAVAVQTDTPPDRKTLLRS
jgi:predicted PurR-regulated permease PerM